MTPPPSLPPPLNGSRCIFVESIESIKLEISKNLKNLDFPNKETWIYEALFGYEHVDEFLNHKNSLDVLEVGCGSGILLSILRRQYPHHRFWGIGPAEGAFSSFKAISVFAEEKGVVKTTTYQTFRADRKFDVIYLVNVFEHLPDWRDFLTKVEGWLLDNGVCIILCPNYSFPYESHFRLPIIINKSLTHRVFRKHIQTCEREGPYVSVGMWDSLNFVKMRHVKKHLSRTALTMTARRDILDGLVHRLEGDKEFQNRQKFMGAIARFLKKIGVLKIMTLKPFENLHPYIKIELRKKG